MIDDGLKETRFPPESQGPDRMGRMANAKTSSWTDPLSKATKLGKLNRLQQRNWSQPQPATQTNNREPLCDETPSTTTATTAASTRIYPILLLDLGTTPHCTTAPLK